MDLFFCRSKKAVEVVQKQGKVCVLDIEIEGVKQVKNGHLMNPLFVFINPPSVEELEKRLRGRNTETEESLRKRLDTAIHEIEYGKFKFLRLRLAIYNFILFSGNIPGNFDAVVHNHSLHEAYEELKEFIVKELELQRDQGINVHLKHVVLSENEAWN